MNNKFFSEKLKQWSIQLINWLKYIKLKTGKSKEIKEKYAHNHLLHNFHLNNELHNKIKIFWKKYGIKVNTLWCRAWISVNGIEDYRYIPEDIFYIFIEPKLNRKDLFFAYVDKNNYDKFFVDSRTPVTILRNINGKYYDRNYGRIKNSHISDHVKKHPGEYIVKPSIDSSRTKNVFKIHIDEQKICMNGQLISIENIEKIIPVDFLVQEFVDQHSLLKNIYSHSLNTFRVVTLRIGDDIHAITSIVKFGDKGNYVDYTVAQGGYHCGVKPEGTLNQFAFDRYYNKYRTHPYTGVAFGDVYIPQFSSLLNFAKNLHNQLLYYDMASWDLAIDKNGEPVLIEVNLMYQGVGYLQINNGPLFGDYTEDILDRCIKRKRI